MDSRRFKSQVTEKICDLDQRKRIHWTQVGLIDPATEASGAGSKREYSYTNLLEFGLCKELFDIGLGIQSVKRILKDLREDGDLKSWAEDYKTYYPKIAKEFESWFETQRDKTFCPPEITGKNPFFWFMSKHPKKTMPPGTPVGVLFYCFKKEERIKVVVPLDLREAVESVFSYKDVWLSKKMIIVDLGMIKHQIDDMIFRYA